MFQGGGRPPRPQLLRGDMGWWGEGLLGQMDKNGSKKAEPSNPRGAFKFAVKWSKEIGHLEGGQGTVCPCV